MAHTWHYTAFPHSPADRCFANARYQTASISISWHIRDSMLHTPTCLQIDAANARYQTAHQQWVEMYDTAQQEWETSKVCVCVSCVCVWGGGGGVRVCVCACIHAFVLVLVHSRVCVVWVCSNLVHLHVQTRPSVHVLCIPRCSFFYIP